MRKLLALLAVLVTVFAGNIYGEERNDADSLLFRVSLVTCYPGQIVYELYGHTAIRIVRGEQQGMIAGDMPYAESRNSYMDKVYNFGMFSFSKPNFIYRFVKGETDYALAGYPFSYFLPEYVSRNSKVVEQVLDLSQEQARELYERLEYLCLPEHREYRYNYVLDNCATRPRDLIEQVTGGLHYPVPADTTLSFRDIMRSYSKNYPWYQFGIDLALGSGIDYRLDARKQMFSPIYLEKAFSKATFTDASGREHPIVRETNVLFDGSESPVLPPTPWFLTPIFVSLLILAVCALLTWRDIRRGKVTRWFDALWFFISGLAGCLVFFLVFVSVHEAASPNYLAFWLNPFCLIVPITIWIKSFRKWLYLYQLINFAIVLILLATWWLNPQTANVAFFPLMLCSLLRSANYLFIYRKCERRSK